VAVLLGVAIALALRRFQTRKSTVVVIGAVLLLVAILLRAFRVR
jgi:hypothetical protein